MGCEDVHTSTLLTRLKKERDFKSFIEKNKDAMMDVTLSTYISELCRKRQLVPERVIKSAQLDRTYGHQLFNGTRRPSRDKAIQLAFGFGMTVEEAQQLLRVAEKSPLYPRIKRDAVILFCLSKGMTVLEPQNLLEVQGLTVLGGDW